MTREEALKIWLPVIKTGVESMQECNEALDMAIKALKAWDKFKQALDKRIIDQGFDEDEWSISYNELIKMMTKCGGVK